MGATESRGSSRKCRVTCHSSLLIVVAPYFAPNEEGFFLELANIFNEVALCHFLFELYETVRRSFFLAAVL